MSTIEILERLVGFPTVSRNSNRPLIDWVRNYLADYSVESHLVPDATGAKANLFASIGPAEEGGVVLSGHTDVVPIDGQHWSSDPFALTERESRLHGRGACDMKGFIAAALSRVPVWRDVQLDRPVHLMFSYDEEVGCLGAPSMIEAAKALLPEPAVVIVGEPTGMRLATEHKGIWTMCTRVRGVEAHSSLTHQGVSAVMLAAELIAHLGELAVKRAAQERTTRFEPPYTTMSVNRIEGGTAVNILAAACEFLWDIRAVPGDSPEAILEQLAAFARARLAQLSVDGRACSVETEVLASVPPLEARRGDAEDLVRTVLAQDAKSVSMPFATEAGQFQRAGWSSIVCGPGCIDQAHKANEFIERSQLDACEAFLDSAIRLQCMRKS